MAYLEQYKKVSADDRVGYYDRYKNVSDTSNIDLVKHKKILTCYWEEMVVQAVKRPKTVETEKPSSDPNEMKKHNVASSLTENSCFWAHVEEALISCKLLTNEGSSVEEKDSAKKELIEFEKYVLDLMKNYAVSSEIFLPGSSFMKW
nr:senescence-associated carboxylesterase 101 [Quercus suber]